MKYLKHYKHGLLLCLAITALTLPRLAVAVDDEAAFDAEHDCLIEPVILADVGSSTQGIVRRLLVERGERIMRGQPIVELESSIERAIVEEAEARADMQGEIATREADLLLAQLDRKRFGELHAKSLVPAQQQDEAMAREQVANAALVQAYENRKLQLLELKRARRALALRTIHSPVDGVVVNQLVLPGELVYDNAVMSVAKLDPLRVEVVLPARLFGEIHPGDSANVFPELQPGESMVANVEVVDAMLDARSGTFGVRLLLTNRDLLIPAGQKCLISFVPHEDDPVIPVKSDENRDIATPATLGAASPANPD